MSIDLLCMSLNGFFGNDLIYRTFNGFWITENYNIKFIYIDNFTIQLFNTFSFEVSIFNNKIYIDTSKFQNIYENTLICRSFNDTYFVNIYNNKYKVILLNDLLYRM